MRLVISDGYTLPFATDAQIVDPVTKAVLLDGLPVISGRYRPALPDAIAEWRWKRSRAENGKDDVTASAELLAAHLVDWDAEIADGKKAPIVADFIRLVPEPILNQLINRVNTWATKEKAADQGN